MILVTGAAGPAGLTIIPALAAQGLPVRALAHRPEQVEKLQAAGAQEVPVGDLTDPVLMKRAFAGVKAVYHIPPSARAQETLMDQVVLGAAREAGVERFVFHSLLHPHLTAIPHHHPKLLMEEALIDSGLPFTILRPTSYMQNWSVRLGEEVLRVPWGPESPLTMVDLEEVAEVAGKVLTEEGHFYATYELCGSDVTFTEMARIMGEAQGKEVRVERIPVAAWRAMLVKFGRTEREAALLGQMAEYYDSGRFRGNAKVLTWLLGRTPRTLAEVLARMK